MRNDLRLIKEAVMSGKHKEIVNLVKNSDQTSGLCGQDRR